MNTVEKKMISFSPPDITDMEINEVIDTLKSGWITTGPKTKKLENLLAEYIGTQKVVCLNSQTAAAELALRLLGVSEGDEVITCAYTYTATASVIEHVNAKIILVDCQENSLEMDYDALENVITEKTKAIIPIDLAGIPCDYDRIFEIVEKNKHLFRVGGKTELGSRIQRAIGRVAIIADAAHAIGASYKGTMVGNIADFTNYSFHAVKNFTTAEGGAITWKKLPGIDDEEIYRQLQLYSLHGQSKDALAKTKLGAWEYDIVGTWYKCNMTDIMASIGLAQISRYPVILARRKEIIERYDVAFKKVGIEVLSHYTEQYSSSGHLYITRIPNITALQRNEIIERMAQSGVATNVHYKPLPMHTAYKRLGFNIKEYPNAYKHYENEISLPLHTCLTDEDVDYVIENYLRIVRDYL